MALSWTTDVSAGQWLSERINGFADDVGSVLPHGFDAYARVFHPLEDGRWADRAARNGRVVHPEMQLHAMSHLPGTDPPAYEPFRDVSVGSLPRPELATTTPDHAWFAVWEGNGLVHGSRAVLQATIPPTPLEPAPQVVPYVGGTEAAVAELLADPAHNAAVDER